MKMAENSVWKINEDMPLWLRTHHGSSEKSITDAAGKMRILSVTGFETAGSHVMIQKKGEAS